MAQSDLASPDHKLTQTIDGKGESSPKFFDVINPSTAAVFAQCPDASMEHLDRAVAAARRAFPEWARKSFAQRRE